MDDIRNASLFEIYNHEKIQGAILGGPKGLSLKMSAQATGVSILMTIKDKDGGPVFGIQPADTGGKTEKEIVLPSGKRVINISHYITNTKDDELFPVMDATVKGTEGKREISVCNMTSSNTGSSDFDLQLADARVWSSAMNKIDMNLMWIEAQFTSYGLIKDPMVPLSLMPVYVAGRESLEQGKAKLESMKELMKGWED